MHVAHGRTNSILLPYVIRYNGSVPEEPTSWPKYNKYIAPERYQEIAKNLGVNPGKTPERGVENLAKAVEDYRDNKLGMNKSFQECGVDEDYYGPSSTRSACVPMRISARRRTRVSRRSEDDEGHPPSAAYYGVSRRKATSCASSVRGEAATEEASERA